MEQTKPIPGTRPFKQQLIECRQDLKKADEQIRDFERKIDEVKKNDAKNSPKAPLLIKRKELGFLIKDLNIKKKDLFEKINQIKETYGDLATKQVETKGFISTESIEKRLREINLEMLKFPCNAQKSKSYEDEIKDLKSKKMNIENEKKKHDVLRQVQDQLKNLNSSLSQVYKELKIKNSEMAEILNSIKEIESQENTKNPVIEGYEKNIENLKIKKEEINKKIIINQDEIAKKREEHQEFLQKKAEAEAYEKRRSDILEKIKDLEIKKESLENEKDKCDASKFDSVIFYLEKKLGEKEEKITFPLDIVMSLSEFKVTIPSEKKQISSTICQLKEKKNLFLEKVEIRKEELKVEIENILENINKEKGLLSDIPVMEVKLPPFTTKSRSK
ncbi:nuclear segregation protein BFR1-like [Vairimorpha necatrix]|uniref:Nuclear segregation protein BFR1-like n=1 Tax=Vairimorpha necatrix TaxID=6039 RepID=A0AAX4J888_9MICR